MTIIRPSALATWNDCARRAAASLFHDELVSAGYTLRKLEPTIGAAVGTAVHSAAAHTMRARADTGHPATVEQATDAGIEAYREEVADGITFDETTDNHNTAQKQIGNMTKAWHGAFARQLAPVLIEHRMQADLGDGFTISGQPDVLAKDERVTLRDLKTGKRFSEYSAQLGAYSMLARAHGWNYEKLVVDFVQRQPLTYTSHVVVPKSVEYDIRHSEQTAHEAIADIKRSHKRFQARLSGHSPGPPFQAFRANPLSMMCNPKFCPAYNTNFCRVHKELP